MLRIKRALISVSDKTGILELAQELAARGVEILSTGGTAKLLKQNNIAVKEVQEYTGFPEMLDGRVKTLHPKIHAGLLALRDDPEHMRILAEQAIGLIDMVVVNLYPFERTTQKPGVSIEEAIENIDIGGPSMLRSAAKNHRSVAVVCNPGRYPEVIAELKKHDGCLSEGLLRSLGVEVFAHTSRYDAAINSYLYSRLFPQAEGAFSDTLHLCFEKVQELRYGENPHQKGAFYKEEGKTKGAVAFVQLQGKELSFNNILDLNSAVELVKEFERPAAVIVKHNNPCGVAESSRLDKAYREAWACDRLSAFGGIVALNRKMDLKTAKVVAKSGFLECIIAPGFDHDALVIFKEKKNLRILESGSLAKIDELDFKRVCGGLLVQDKDVSLIAEKGIRTVTKIKPSKSQVNSLIFAWKVAKHVKSNAIVLACGTRTLGIGAGQMSRVDSVFIATKKAGRLSSGAVLASDAFFPKEDAVSLAARYKIKAIIQPGGSIADEAIIAAANKHRIAMVFTGMRHFRH